jgi:hypothetical protein
MDMRGYGKIATYRAKASLGIATRRVNGEWVWVWYDQAMVKWLEKRLDGGPVLVTELFEEAGKFHWHRESVKMAREVIGTIRFSMVDNKLYWMNTSGSVEIIPEQPRELLSVIKKSTYSIKQYAPARVISVDFSEPEEYGDVDIEIPDMSDIERETTPHSHEVVLLTGVKIGVFDEN